MAIFTQSDKKRKERKNFTTRLIDNVNDRQHAINWLTHFCRY